MKKAISEIKWVAIVRGDDKLKNDIIKIGIQHFEDDYRDVKYFDLVASNDDDVSQGGFDTETEAIDAVYKLWGHWDTFSTKDSFELMIKDWQFDNAPEYDDLEIDEPVFNQETGGWEATASDDKCIYSLTDDGTGNIVINYVATK